MIRFGSGIDSVICRDSPSTRSWYCSRGQPELDFGTPGSNSGNRDLKICAREISLQVDLVCKEIAVIFEGRGDYGFFLTPLLD